MFAASGAALDAACHCRLVCVVQYKSIELSRASTLPLGVFMSLGNPKSVNKPTLTNQLLLIKFNHTQVENYYFGINSDKVLGINFHLIPFRDLNCVEKFLAQPVKVTGSIVFSSTFLLKKF